MANQPSPVLNDLLNETTFPRLNSMYSTFKVHPWKSEAWKTVIQAE